MNKAKLYNALDGLSAYDIGCTDSGIKDEGLRQEVINYLESLREDEFRLIISEFIREHYLSDETLKQGYGIKDVKEFIEWLSDYMDVVV